MAEALATKTPSGMAAWHLVKGRFGMARPPVTPKEDPEIKAAREALNKLLPPGQKIAKDGLPHPSTSGFLGDDIKVDWSNWRQRMRTATLKLDDVAKEKFFEYFAETGMLFNSAYRVGVSVQCIKNHIKNDPEFEEGFAEAKQRYADKIERVAQEVAQTGIFKPIIGGKERDFVVAYERVVATNILAMQMKRSNPEYREKSELDLNVKGGVLVAPATLSPDEWVKQFGSPEAKPEIPE